MKGDIIPSLIVFFFFVNMESKINYSIRGPKFTIIDYGFAGMYRSFHISRHFRISQLCMCLRKQNLKLLAKSNGIQCICCAKTYAIKVPVYVSLLWLLLLFSFSFEAMGCIHISISTYHNLRKLFIHLA